RARLGGGILAGRHGELEGRAGAGVVEGDGGGAAVAAPGARGEVAQDGEAPGGGVAVDPGAGAPDLDEGVLDQVLGGGGVGHAGAGDAQEGASEGGDAGLELLVGHGKNSWRAMTWAPDGARIPGRRQGSLRQN